MENDEILKYPIGPYVSPKEITDAIIKESIITIKRFPFELEVVVASLSKVQMENSYRSQGWYGFQIVHHCADSHVNAYIRFKLALTENEPLIKPYNEQQWADLIDGRANDVQASLSLIKGLHFRWGLLLEGICKKDWERSYVHPDGMKKIDLKSAVCLYAWHCRHHLEHLKLLKNE